MSFPRMDENQTASELKAAIAEAQALAREQVAAAWQLQVDRIREELESGWRDRLDHIFEERFADVDAFKRASRTPWTPGFVNAVAK